MNRRNNMVIGMIFVILGVWFLLKNFNIIDFNINIFSLIGRFWATLFLIIPGLAIHSVFFSGKNRDAGILVPGGILLVTGITCQISMLFHIWHIAWPGFILAVAVGLFELYLFGTRNKALLIPVGIFGFLSLTFFETFTINAFFSSGFVKKLLLSAVFILIGLLIIFRNRPKKDNF